MIGNYRLPTKLKQTIGSEPLDFIAKDQPSTPFGVLVSVISMGIVWIILMSCIIYAFIGPLFHGEEVEMTINDVPTIISPENLTPLILPVVLLGIFWCLGLLFLVIGLGMLFKGRGYTVGTATKLIYLYKNKIQTTSWDQINGVVSCKGNNRKGNILLQLKTGKDITFNGKKRFVNDTLYMCGIKNALDINKICKKRIKKEKIDPSSISPTDINILEEITHSTFKFNPFQKFRKRSFIASLSLSVLMLIGFGVLVYISAQSQSQSESQTSSEIVTSGQYTNTEYGFSFDLPTGWELQNEESNVWEDLQRINFTKPGFIEPFYEADTLMGITINNNTFLLNYKLMAWNLSKEYEERITVGGKEAFYKIGRHEFGEYLVAVLFLTTDEEPSIQLTLRTNEEPYLSEFNALLDSFEFLN